MPKHKLLPLITIFVVLVLVIVCYSLILIPFVKQVNERDRIAADYTTKTTPLKADVVQDICKKLELSLQDKRCEPGVTVYAPEFFDDIKSYLHNLPDDKSNSEEVDKILGPYKFACDPPTPSLNSGKPFRCLYDLRGDEIAIIGVYFNKNGTIDHVRASAGGS